MKPTATFAAAVVAVVALATAPTVAAAPAGRALLAIGSNVGLDDEAPLGHAVDDARRVAALFGELGGTTPASTAVLADPSSSAVLAEIAALATRAAGAEVVFVYVSGHGDEQALHLAGGRLPLAELQQAVAALPASLKVIVIDACRSTGIREKGVAAGASFSVSLPASPGHHEGLVTLLASGPGEAAQESARLQGGVFTHYLVSGLRGAADRDGDRRVTLAEAYDFAYGRTLARSVASTGTAQRPELMLSLRGSGPLVVTELDPARSRLVLPAGADVHYFVYVKGSTAVMAEAWGRPDRPTTLALPAGRFVVQRQLGAASGAAEAGLPFDGEASLTTAAFVPVSAERMLARGGLVDLHRHTLGVAGGAAADRGFNLGPAIGLWYGRAVDDLLLQAGLGLGTLRYDTRFNAVESLRIDGSLGAGRRWVGGRVTFHALAEVALRLERQRLRDLRADGAPSDGGPAPVHDQALAPGVGARAGASVGLGARLAFVVELGARAFVVRARASDGRTQITVAPDLGVRVGLSRAF